MTPQEIFKAVRELREELGPRAVVDLYIGGDDDSQIDKPISAYCRPLGFGTGLPAISEYVSDWAEGIAVIRARWAEMSERAHADIIKKMALAIIRITAEQGECTDAALRAEFDPADCERFGDTACEKANEMAANGPFSVRRLVGANAA
jgi:hypothetical protein